MEVSDLKLITLRLLMTPSRAQYISEGSDDVPGPPKRPLKTFEVAVMRSQVTSKSPQVFAKSLQLPILRLHVTALTSNDLISKQLSTFGN